MTTSAICATVRQTKLLEVIERAGKRTALRPVAADAPAAPEPCVACLTLLKGAGLGRTFWLKPGRYIIGRAVDCDIIIDEDGVSRRHALLVVSDDRKVVVEDLGSTNGTVVDNRRYDIMSLAGGERLRFGASVVAKFEFHDALEAQVRAEMNSYREELEVEVRARTAELETAVREQESFSYSVSHDLRAPLRTIDGFCYALLDDYSQVLDENGRSMLHRVRAASQRMGELIDALLSLSRTSRRRLNFTDVNITAIARDCFAEKCESEPSREVEFAVAEDVIVRGDETLLRIVVDNLVSNAWKYTASQTHARIEVGTGGTNGIFVRDNGVGFNMSYADKLFIPFQRLHSDQDFDGTGIGLATVARIVERHGGEVWAEGQEGEGATFWFALPDV